MERPSILGIQSGHALMLLLLRRLIGVHREVDGTAVRELVMELGVVVVGLRERRVVRHVADAELRRVRPGHVRRRSLDDVCEAGMVRPVARSVVEARNEAGRFIHRNGRRIVRILLRAPPPEVGSQLNVAFEQQPGRHRRCPGDLGHRVRAILDALERFRRGNRPGEGLPGTGAALDAVLADPLVVREEVELVSLRRLPGQPQGAVLPPAVVDGHFEWSAVLAIGGEIRPLGVIAGVQVDPHAGDILVVGLVAERAEEPQLVLDDRAAERGVDVPRLRQGLRRRQALGLQLRRQVRALERAARAVDEEGPGVPVAALLADDVHLRAAGVRLAEAARQREHHFLRIPDFGDVGRHAHALVAGAHAVDLDLSLVSPPAVDLEHVEDATLGSADVVALNVDRRDERDEAAILP